MTTHTPGLWEVRDTIKGPYIVRKGASLGDGAIAKILKVTGIGRLLEREREKAANARLIAAAPELRDVLARLITEAGYRLEQTGLLQQVHDEARALLARIDGAEAHS